MLECKACVLRSIRAIAGDAYVTASVQRSLILTPQLANRPSRRRLATAAAAAAAAEASSEVQQDALSTLAPVPKPTKDIIRSSRGGTIVINNQQALRKELIHLKDRVKLADHVHYVLRNNKPEKALDICRLASREMQCIVAWNHTIAWHLENGKVKQALDIYNEMKKRGQFPDSYTYMRLFKGLMDKPEHLSKVVSIYNTMSSPTSKVKPNVMHTNAVLRACALAKDMDALWGVVAGLPERGLNAADATTYGTILQSIRHSAMGDEQDPRLMESQRQEAVNEGRRIWQEIIQKWRNGELIIDQVLVTAMANLLLISRRLQDTDDVLSLVQQTTNLERLIDPVGTPDRKNIQHIPKKLFTPHDEHGGDLQADGQTQMIEDPEGFVAAPSASAFKPVTALARDSSRSRRATSPAWVKPDNGILSALLRACRIMRTSKTAYAYWDALTSPPYNLKPDLSNFQEILRMFHVNRSAVKASHVVERAHNEYGIQATPATYQLAMSVCARDHKNPNIIEPASRIIDDMTKHLSQPDIITLEQYLSLALTTSDGPQIVAALEKLSPIAEQMRDMASQPRIRRKLTEQELKERRYRADDQENALRLLRTMIGTIDTLKRRELIPEKAQEYWGEQRSKLDSYLATTKWNLADRKRERRERRADTQAKVDTIEAAKVEVEQKKENDRIYRSEQERRMRFNGSGAEEALGRFERKNTPYVGLVRRHASASPSQYNERKGLWRSRHVTPSALNNAVE